MTEIRNVTPLGPKVTFPLYVVGQTAFYVVKSADDILREFEVADFAPGSFEVYDSLFRPVKIQSIPFSSREVQVDLDREEDVQDSRLWLRLSLLEICVMRKEYGLSSEETFCIPLEELITRLNKAIEQQR